MNNTSVSGIMAYQVENTVHIWNLTKPNLSMETNQSRDVSEYSMRPPLIFDPIFDF